MKLKRHKKRPLQYILLRYLSADLFGKIVGVAVILTALMEILTLLEEIGHITHRHLGLGGVAYFALLRLPLLLGFSLPISMLIGALITLSKLTLNSEIAIMRAAGLSTWQLVKLLLPVTILFGMICAINNDQISPRTEMILATWWNKTDPAPQDTKPFWFRNKSFLVKIGYLENGGETLHDISIFQRNTTGDLDLILQAKTANFDRDHWILHTYRALKVSADSIKDEKENASTNSLTHDSADNASSDNRAAYINADRIWPVSIGPKEMIFLSMERPPHPIGRMWASIKGNLPSHLPPSFFKTGLLDRLLLPISFIIMLMMALPVIYIPPRTGTRSWLPVWCLGGGLLFIVFQGVLRALGNAGTLPAPLAIIPGIFIFFLGVGTIILRIEEK